MAGSDHWPAEQPLCLTLKLTDDPHAEAPFPMVLRGKQYPFPLLA